jgi:hypothetical protein
LSGFMWATLARSPSGDIGHPADLQDLADCWGHVCRNRIAAP